MLGFPKLEPLQILRFARIREFAKLLLIQFCICSKFRILPWVLRYRLTIRLQYFSLQLIILSVNFSHRSFICDAGQRLRTRLTHIQQVSTESFRPFTDGCFIRWINHVIEECRSIRLVKLTNHLAVAANLVHNIANRDMDNLIITFIR